MKTVPSTKTTTTKKKQQKKPSFPFQTTFFSMGFFLLCQMVSCVPYYLKKLQKLYSQRIEIYFFPNWCWDPPKMAHWKVTQTFWVTMLKSPCTAIADFKPFVLGREVRYFRMWSTVFVIDNYYAYTPLGLLCINQGFIHTEQNWEAKSNDFIWFHRSLWWRGR